MYSIYQVVTLPNIRSSYFILTCNNKESDIVDIFLDNLNKNDTNK